jgi:hypothetical protein
LQQLFQAFFAVTATIAESNGRGRFLMLWKPLECPGKRFLCCGRVTDTSARIDASEAAETALEQLAGPI